MFTGLIEEIGTIESVSTSPAGRALRIRSSYTDLADGESVAVNGACLTVHEQRTNWFTVAAVVTTLERTAIAEWKQGQRVNLERAMRADGRFGGHIVQGHVDGVGIVSAVVPLVDALLLDIDLPESLSESVVEHGSVAIDGVSLTVNSLSNGRLQVSIIDYTLKHTALGDLEPGSRVHVETDLIGKYVLRLLGPYTRTGGESRHTKESC
jgi:riboflavin synthase